MKSIIKITALAAALMLLGGCYAGAIVTPTPMPESSQLRPQTSISPQSGGEISIPMPEKPYTWHPLFVKESGMSNIFSMIFEPLIAIDSQLLPAVSIANSWEFDGEGCVIVRLRSGVQFHNSDTLTSGDVVFTFNMVLENPESIYHSQVSEYVESVEAVDANTVRFHPKKAGYAIYYALSVPVIPESVYAVLPQQTDAMPIGTGGFAVGAYNPGDNTSLELVRNTYWWKKQPYIEKIHAVGYRDNAAAIQAFIDGRLDCVPTDIYTTDIYDSYSGVSCYSYMSNYYDFLAPNFKNDILTDVNIRRAISYAVDRKGIIANIYINHGISMEYPFAGDCAFNNDDIQRCDYSVSKACSLLEAAGWLPGEDGIRVKNGKRLSFRLLTLRNDDNPVRRDTAAMLRRQLAEAGMEIQTVTEDGDALREDIAQGNFDLLLTGYYFSGSPDASFALKTGGSGNVMRYSDSECDAYFARLDAARTRDEYASVYAQLQQYVAKQLPQIGLIGFSQTLIHRDRLVPCGINRDLRVYENMDKWYVTQA